MNRGPAMWWGNERAAIWKPRREASVESNPAGTLSLNSMLLYVGESKFLLFMPFHLCYLEEGNGTPLHYSCQGNPIEGEAWWTTVHGVAKSWTWLSDFTFTFHFSCIGEGNGNPLQCSCLENPRDRGAWWASFYGVAESRTWLTRLSSSSSSICVILLWEP